MQADANIKTPHEEISEVLRRAINGDVACVVPAGFVDWWKDSEPTFIIGGWQICCFVESGWIYDIYSALSPDGRYFEFSVREDDSGIELFLSDDEVEKLCLRLGAKF